MCILNKTDNPKDTIYPELKKIESSKIQLGEFQCLPPTHLWVRKEKVGAGKEVQLPKDTFHGVRRRNIETWCNTYSLFIVPWKYSAADGKKDAHRIRGSANRGLIQRLKNLRIYMQTMAKSFPPSSGQPREDEEDEDKEEEPRVDSYWTTNTIQGDLSWWPRGHTAGGASGHFKSPGGAKALVHCAGTHRRESLTHSVKRRTFSQTAKTVLQNIAPAQQSETSVCHLWGHSILSNFSLIT